MAVAALGHAINSFTGSRFLQELDISNVGLQADGVKALDAIINSSADIHIHKLNISGNHITELGRPSLLSIVKKLSRQLSALNIKYNQLNEIEELN